MTKNEMDFLKEKRDNADIQKAIINVVAYFDMFDYPLTDFEVWKFLLQVPSDVKLRQITLSEVKEFLCGDENTNLLIGELISHKNGFYFLKGRENIIRTRLDRYNFTDRKFKRALRVAKIYSFLPWIKMIVISNIKGANNMKDNGDIDLFIVCEKRKIWTTRFFCVGFAKIFGLRPEKNNLRDKICLNFYISEDNLNLKKYMIDDGDIDYIYWLAGFITIYEKDGMYKKFIQDNQWLKNYLPNWQEAKITGRRSVKGKENLLFSFLFGSFESMFKKIQLRILPVKLKELINRDTRVVINDEVLKLHAKDRREEYRKRWEEKISNF